MLEADRIRIARLRGGDSVSEFAARVGVSERTIHTWESQGAPEANCDRLSRVTGLPGCFFSLGAPASPEVDAVFFRARRRTAKSVLNQATAYSALTIDLYREVCSLLGLPNLDLEVAEAGTDPKEAAQAIRLAWNLGELPLPNLIQLSEAHGIRVVGMPAEIDNVDAFSFWSPEGRPFIVLSRAKTPERSRFDLAHELGHLVLHSDTMGQESTDRRLEAEANAFAAEFLMPTNLVRASISVAPALEHILQFKTRLGVSALAALLSVYDAGRLSEWTYRSYRTQLLSEGFDRAEPGSTLPFERSRVFEALAKVLRKRRLAPHRWANSIGLPTQDVSAFTFGQLLTGTDGEGHGERKPQGRPALRLVTP